MARVVLREVCGNSPKNLFLQELTIAFARGDTAMVLSRVTDDICGNIVGSRQVHGKEEFAAALARRAEKDVVKLTIQPTSYVSALLN